MNKTRELVAAYVRDNPQASYSEIARALGLGSTAAVTYHLKNLGLHSNVIRCPHCHGSGIIKLPKQK